MEPFIKLIIFEIIVMVSSAIVMYIRGKKWSAFALGVGVVYSLIYLISITFMKKYEDWTQIIDMVIFVPIITILFYISYRNNQIRGNYKVYIVAALVGAVITMVASHFYRY